MADSKSNKDPLLPQHSSQAGPTTASAVEQETPSRFKFSLPRFILSCAVFVMVYTSLSALNKAIFRRIGRVSPPCVLPVQNRTLLDARVRLPSGDYMPFIALGTWKSSQGEVGSAVKAALEAGYRHIDGAWAYGNEAEVGQAIKDCGIEREKVWLTSKLWNTFHAPEDVESTLDETLQRLQTTYVDLYLMHWPVAFKKERGPRGETIIDKELTENPLPTWQKMEEMVKKGKARNIGVSNFNIRRYKNLTEGPIKIKPAVNQVELSFWNPQPELVKWAKEEGVILEAYSPLGSNDYVKKSLNVPEVKEAAKDLGMTPAQVLISWQQQRGNVVLPKSVTPSRIRENLQVQTLPKKYFDKIEKAATSHPAQRLVDPSKSWGLDIFEDKD